MYQRPANAMRGDCLIYTAIDSRAFPILFIRLLPPTTTLSPPLLSCASAANDDHLNYVHIIHYIVCVCTSNIKLAEAKLSKIPPLRKKDKMQWKLALWHTLFGIAV